MHNTSVSSLVNIVLTESILGSNRNFFPKWKDCYPKLCLWKFSRNTNLISHYFDFICKWIADANVEVIQTMLSWEFAVVSRCFVKQWADLNIKRDVMFFPYLFVLFFSFLVCLHKYLVVNWCHSSRVNHFTSLTIGNNLFSLPVRNYGVGRECLQNNSFAAIQSKYENNKKTKTQRKAYSKEVPEPVMSLSCTTSFQAMLMNPWFLC